jgi:hypothetical protein
MNQADTLQRESGRDPIRLHEQLYLSPKQFDVLDTGISVVGINGRLLHSDRNMNVEVSVKADHSINLVE